MPTRGDAARRQTSGSLASPLSARRPSLSLLRAGDARRQRRLRGSARRVDDTKAVRCGLGRRVRLRAPAIRSPGDALRPALRSVAVGSDRRSVSGGGRSECHPTVGSYPPPLAGRSSSAPGPPACKDSSSGSTDRGKRSERLATPTARIFIPPLPPTSVNWRSSAVRTGTSTSGCSIRGETCRAGSPIMSPPISFRSGLAMDAVSRSPPIGTPRRPLLACTRRARQERAARNSCWLHRKPVSQPTGRRTASSFCISGTKTSGHCRWSGADANRLPWLGRNSRNGTASFLLTDDGWRTCPTVPARSRSTSSRFLVPDRRCAISTQRWCSGAMAR